MEKYILSVLVGFFCGVLLLVYFLKVTESTYGDGIHDGHIETASGKVICTGAQTADNIVWDCRKTQDVRDYIDFINRIQKTNIPQAVPQDGTAM